MLRMCCINIISKVCISYFMGIHRYHYLSRRSRDDNDIEDDP